MGERALLSSYSHSFLFFPAMQGLTRHSYLVVSSPGRHYQVPSLTDTARTDGPLYMSHAVDVLDALVCILVLFLGKLLLTN
jgi:hypothetical protein